MAQISIVPPKICVIKQLVLFHSGAGRAKLYRNKLSLRVLFSGRR
jgi:hypothetical protein